MFSLTSKGSFNKTEAFLKKMVKAELLSQLDKYGMIGVNALSNATPTRTGLSASAWYYTTEKKGGVYSITWRNANLVEGVPVVILLQYGHGTGTGGYVQGHDFINPAIQPVFDKIAEDVWRVVTSA